MVVSLTLYLLLSHSVYAKRVYQLNTKARQTRIQTSVSMVEQTVVPVVKSKVTEVSTSNVIDHSTYCKVLQNTVTRKASIIYCGARRLQVQT